MKVTHRQLRPVVYGLAIARGAVENDICANCGKERLRKHFGVLFPDGEYGIVCSTCYRKYRMRKAELVKPVETTYYRSRGRELVLPTSKFFSYLTVTPFTESIVEYYNKHGYLTLKQYNAAKAIRRYDENSF